MYNLYHIVKFIIWFVRSVNVDGGISR